jgi:hypothetical protein
VIGASVVDVDALLQVVWVSLALGVGVTGAFSCAILGATRFVDMRSEGRHGPAVLYGVLALVAVVTVIAAAVFGIVVMIHKD